MDRGRRLSTLAGTAILTLALGGLAACGSDDSSAGGGSGGTSDKFILGTTETVTAMDPAGSYDFGSWNLQYHVFEQLMTIPAGETDPVGDAAENCDYDDPATVTCTLKKGLTFSNGDPLTSSDVKFSLERNIAIADPNGSAVLLGQLTDPDTKKVADGAIETPDDSTVVFHLNAPDTTFLKLLTTATTSIVDEDVFPADKLMDDTGVIGSGPYQLSKYEPDQLAVLEANPEYSGDRTPQTKQIFVQYFADAAPLKQAIATGQVDIAWRTLSPTDLNDLATTDGVQVVKGEGSEFRYWVFQLENDAVKDVAVRQAVAQVIDRDKITKNAYDGTTAPAYSIVPPGFGGQKDSFKEKYGQPSADKAKQILEDAGVSTPVKLTLGYTPTHYGPNAVDEANELAAELNQSGVFEITTEDAEWEEYQNLYKQGAYDLFILGWYPDILDADNYLTPFLRDGGFYANGYSNDKVNSLLDDELAQTDEAKREEIFGQLQDITAEDVPLVPSWNGQNVAVTTDAVSGVKETLDPTYIFRFWGITKSE